ncbi:MAG TPA: hypothetical protein VJ824_11940 [Bacillota bacterium]|nr:hypothetical protein [Bacillota bacterium]
MSMPQIPTIVAGTINISRQEVINLLLASIAMEELSLAHIVNAEAEKIQAVLGTLPGGPSSVHATTFGDLLQIDRSVGSILRDVIKKEMLLQFKLEDVLEILEPPTCQISLISRQVLSQGTDVSVQRFLGTAQGTNQVIVEILLNDTIFSSTIATVNNNHQFEATLEVPVGLSPYEQATIRVRSVDHPNCKIEQLVFTVPIVP